MAVYEYEELSPQAKISALLVSLDYLLEENQEVFTQSDLDYLDTLTSIEMRLLVTEIYAGITTKLSGTAAQAIIDDAIEYGKEEGFAQNGNPSS